MDDSIRYLKDTVHLLACAINIYNENHEQVQCYIDNWLKVSKENIETVIVNRPDAAERVLRAFQK